MKIKKPLKSVAEQALWATSPGAMSAMTLASRLPRRPRRVVKVAAVGSVVYSAAKLAYDNSPAVQRKVDLVAAQVAAWGTRFASSSFHPLSLST